MTDSEEKLDHPSNKIITLPINLDNSFSRKTNLSKESLMERENNIKNIFISNEDSSDEMLSFYIPKGDRLSFAPDNIEIGKIILSKTDSKSADNINCIRSKSDNLIICSNELKNNIIQNEKDPLKLQSEDKIRNENSFSFLTSNTECLLIDDHVPKNSYEIKSVRCIDFNIIDDSKTKSNINSLNLEGKPLAYEKKKCEKITHKRYLSDGFEMNKVERKLIFRDDYHSENATENKQNTLSTRGENSPNKNLKGENLGNLKKYGYFNETIKETTHKRTRSNVPFERIKEKLQDDYVEFLKNHRFSSVLTGNKKYEGKSGDYYLALKHLDTKMQKEYQTEGDNHPGFNNYDLNLSYFQKMAFTVDEKSYKISTHDSKNESNCENHNISNAKNKQKFKTKYKNYTENKQKDRVSCNSSLPKIKLESNNNHKKLTEKLKNKLHHKEYSTFESGLNLGVYKKNTHENELNNKRQKPKQTKNRISSNLSSLCDAEDKKQSKLNEKNDSSYKKNSIDLTPIPTKTKNKIKIIDKEYSKAERAAVLIRRIEYSCALKNKKDEMQREVINFYYELIREVKVVVIQRWWRKLKKHIEFNSKKASVIQKQIRGFLARKSLALKLRISKLVYPFLTKFENIIRRNRVSFCYYAIYTKFGILAQKKFVLKLIKLIQKCYRIHLNKVKEKRKKILRSFYLIARDNLSKCLNKILKYDRILDKICLIQSFYRGIVFRSDPKNHLRLGKEIHPFLYYYMRYYKKNTSMYYIKTQNFYNKIFTRLLDILTKIRISKFSTKLYFVFRHNSGRRNFLFLKKKLMSYRFYKLKIKMLIRQLKTMLPNLNRTFLRKSFKIWRNDYYKTRNQCRLGVNLFLKIFKISVWNKFMKKALIEKEKKCLIKKLYRVFYITTKNSLSRHLTRLKLLNHQMKCKESKISKILKTKHFSTQKIILEKFKKNYYYCSYFIRSYNIDKGHQILKRVFLNRVITEYKYNNEFLKNLKTLFLHQKKRTKLKKVFNISKVYYIHKKKIHFENFFEVAHRLNEIEMNRINILANIITGLNEKLRLMKLIRFLRFSLYCFKRKNWIRGSNYNLPRLSLGKNLNKNSLIKGGFLIMMNPIYRKLNEILNFIKFHNVQKKNLNFFLSRLCFVVKTIENNQNIISFNILKNTFSNKHTDKKIPLKFILRNRILNSNKISLQKNFYKWNKITNSKISNDFIESISLIPKNLFKMRNRIFVNTISKILIGENLKSFVKKCENFCKLKLLMNSINYNVNDRRSCRCKQLSITQACEKFFVYRHNQDRKLKRVMFDRFKMAAGILFINTYARGSQIIFKRKVTKLDKRKNIMKYLIKNFDKNENKLKIYFAKWRIIIDILKKNKAAYIIQEFIRLKLTPKNEDKPK